jgi:hypothetical protein
MNFPSRLTGDSEFANNTHIYNDHVTWSNLMLTKAITAIILSGALWVAGDAAYRQFGCCHLNDTCPLSGGCCHETPTQPSGDCCSQGASRADLLKSCCENGATAAKADACCDAAISFCTRTGEFYQGCCCEVVNGQYRCLLTGEISDECCCIPVE